MTVKEPVPVKEMTMEEKAVHERNKIHKQRAAKIAELCSFVRPELTDRANQCIRTLEMLFHEFTQELTLLMPDNHRTAAMLDSLETACMWAKKSIEVADYEYTKKQKETENGKDNSNPN